MARKMTAAEKKRFKNYFPKLDVNRAVVTGAATRQYNCIAWTVGVTTRWIWPGAHISNFDRFYNSRGHVRASNGPVAAWGHGPSSMTHACISGPGHGPRWESKCGRDLRIRHGLDELLSSSYGRVVAFYNKRRVLLADSDIDLRLENASHVKGARKVKLRKEQAEVMKSVIAEVDKQVIDEFETKFSAWVQTWDAPHTAHLSDPSFVRFSEEFAALVAMGADILPLVVEKLTDPDNFFALQLYDALQPEAMSVVHIDPEDDAIFEGEQGRAERTVERWIANL